MSFTLALPEYCGAFWVKNSRVEMPALEFKNGAPSLTPYPAPLPFTKSVDVVTVLKEEMVEGAAGVGRDTH
jgi:hypothetical protein